jgi:hypothetical protein
VQHLSRDVTEVAELRVEVTQVRAATVMVRGHAAQVERMAHERVVLLPTARRAQDVVEEKIPSLAAKTVAAKR